MGTKEGPVNVLGKQGRVDRCRVRPLHTAAAGVTWFPHSSRFRKAKDFLPQLISMGSSVLTQKHALSANVLGGKGKFPSPHFDCAFIDMSLP